MVNHMVNGAEPTEVHITNFKDFACPHPEETTAYIVYMLKIMAEIAMN